MNVRQTLESGLQELRTLRDEIRLQLHLAGQEARDRWEQNLEPYLDKLEMQVRSATDSTLDTLREAIDRAKSSFREYRAQLTSGSSGGASASDATTEDEEPDFVSVPPDRRYH